MARRLRWSPNGRVVAAWRRSVLAPVRCRRAAAGALARHAQQRASRAIATTLGHELPTDRWSVARSRAGAASGHLAVGQFRRRLWKLFPTAIRFPRTAEWYCRLR